VHAAEHDVVGVRAFGGVLGQLEGVAHEIGVLDDLVTLVEVAQNQQFGAETLLGVGDALLQFLVGRKALQNRHRTAADQREQRRRALNLERLCDGGIGCDVDAGQLDLAVELVHRVTQCACHGEQTVVGRHPQEQQNRERGGGLHHGLERVLRGVDDISASRRSAARLPRLGLHLMLERFQINGSRQ